jgi:hypothetical protein
MPSRRIEQQIETLNSLRHGELTAAALDALRKALGDSVNLVSGKAAAIAAECQATQLMPDLRKAFERLFQDGRKSDPQCWGKIALAKALKDLGCRQSEPFMQGLRYIQMEPVWGGEEDTAAALRGSCALALVQCTDLTQGVVLRLLIEALTEGAATVRADAALALQQVAGEEAALLLRLKARCGDKEPSVTGQVLESLLIVEGGSAVPFVTEFLTFGDEEVREEAALALGTSRLPDAITALEKAWQTTRHIRHGEPLLRGISASRQDSAIEFLLGIIREGRTTEAIEALKALELHRDTEYISKCVAGAVQERAEETVRKEWTARFQSP